MSIKIGINYENLECLLRGGSVITDATRIRECLEDPSWKPGDEGVEIVLEGMALKKIKRLVEEAILERERAIVSPSPSPEA